MLELLNPETDEYKKSQQNRPKIARSFHDEDLPDLSHVANPVPYMTPIDKVAAACIAVIMLAPLAAAAWGSYFV